MESGAVFELIGYLASGVVALSLMMRSVTRLRVINMVGCMLFTVYGLLIGAYPVAAMNGFIFFVNLYHLYQSAGEKRPLAA